MEGKFVFYNGGTESYLPCDNPKDLEVGRKYELDSIDQRKFFTYYTLKGVEGRFNSCWFNEAPPKVFLAVSHSEPLIGEPLKVTRIIWENGVPELQEGITSIVASTSIIGDNLYKVITERKVIYIVQVMC